MQGIDPEKVKQSVDNSYLANRARASEETNPFAMLGVGAGVWYGLGQAMDKFNPKCAGEYNQTILGKVGHFGDKVSTKTFLGRKFESFVRWMDKGFEKLAEKSKIIYTLRNHSTRPEWSFAKTPGAGLHGFLAMDTEQVFEEFLKPIAQHPAEELGPIPLGKKYNAFQKLEQYGMSQDKINKLVESVKDLDFNGKALELQKAELECLKVNKNLVQQAYSQGGLEGLKELAKQAKVRLLGFDSMDDYMKLKGKFLDNPDKVMDVLKKGIENSKKLLGKELNVSIWRSGNKVKNNLLGRTVHLSEYLNKYKATLGKGNHTTLGKFLPKAMGWLAEGCTNRFAGGKLAVAMQAGIFADMLIHTYKAPKGEKGKTFAERFVNDFTYFLSMTAGIFGMHKLIGAFKYLGADKVDVENYRTALKEFNEKVLAKAFTSKKEYKDALKVVNSHLHKKPVKDPLGWLLRKAGILLNSGNERALSYRSNSKYNLNWLRKCANGNILGVPLRIIIPMAIVSPFLAKWATKACHAVFGKPTKSVLDEDKEEEMSEQEKLQQEQLAKLMEQAQQKAQAQQANQPFVSNNSPTNMLNPYKNSQTQQTQQSGPEPFVSNNSPTNLLNMRKNGNTYQETIPSMNDNTQTSENGQNITNNTTNNIVNNNGGKENQNPEEPVRTYVPSPEPVVIANNSDLSAVDQALKRADEAEKLAMETLSMRN